MAPMGIFAVAFTLLGSMQVSCKPHAGLAPVPGCNCPSGPNPALTGPLEGEVGGKGKGKGKQESRAQKWKRLQAEADKKNGKGSNEVEVLTLDVAVANKVRYGNATMAAEIAKLMNVPVSRVSVTPYSWAPQAGVAFVQEEHERCACELGNDGFQPKAWSQIKKEVGGVKLDADTTIMTKKEHEAVVKRDAEEKPIIPNKVVKMKAAAKDKDANIPARIQMLSRDPCLIEQIVENAPMYSKRIAQMLGLKAGSVMLIPPAVKGTVGLIQVGAETETMSVLAVRHCNKKPHTMALVVAPPPAKKTTAKVVAKAVPAKVVAKAVAKAVPAKAAATKAAPAKAVPAKTTATKVVAKAATKAVAKVVPATKAVAKAVAKVAGAKPASGPSPDVMLPMKCSNVFYDSMMSNPKWTKRLTGIMKQGLALTGEKILASNVQLVFYPGVGSMDVEAKVSLPPGANAAKIAGELKGAVASKLVAMLKQEKAALAAFSHGEISCVAGTPSVVAAGKPVQQNRAWISFFSIVVEPPNAKKGAMQFVEMVNTPGSQLARLLPGAMAFVPGMEDRSIGSENGAIETRLPPPMPSAFTFGMPSDASMQADMKEQQKRMKMETHIQKNKLATRYVWEARNANKALKEGVMMKAAIKKADAGFLNAARAHASALIPTSAIKMPEIVPPPEDDTAESPYPPGFLGFLQKSA